jgi:hypothetical protein
MSRGGNIMAINDSGDWRELFDVALFEPNRVKLRQRIERAKLVINDRLDALTKEHNENERNISERIALRDALTTLAELNRIASVRKSNAGVHGERGRAIG